MASKRERKYEAGNAFSWIFFSLGLFLGLSEPLWGIWLIAAATFLQVHVACSELRNLRAGR